MNLHPHTYTAQKECDLPDGLHVVLSWDVDEPTAIVVWSVLPNHAEWLVAKEAIEAYADETEGVEGVRVELARATTGNDLRLSVERDVAELRQEPD